MSGFDEKWLAEYTARTGLGIHGEKPTIAQTDTEKKRSKYGNERVTRNGRKFDSKHEAAVYELLNIELKGDENNVALMCQVPFMLPGGIKYIADFVMLHKVGGYTVYDAKSDATNKDKVYRLKKKLMQECLGISITEM